MRFIWYYYFYDEIQNNENTNESQNENQSVNQSVDEEGDIIIEYNNYTLINSIYNFFRYVKGKTPGEIPIDIASDIICGQFIVL